MIDHAEQGASVGLWFDRLLLGAGVGLMVDVLVGAVRGGGRAAPRNPPWLTWRTWELVAPVLLGVQAMSGQRSAIERWGRILVAGAFALEFVVAWERWWRRGNHIALHRRPDLVPRAEPEQVGSWVCLPDLGDRVGEAVVTRWLGQEGDAVRAGRPLFEVSTDKVETEIPSPADGVLSRIVVPAGAGVTVGTRLALISATQPAGPTDPPPFPEIGKPIS